jgi:hypothetical protein
MSKILLILVTVAYLGIGVDQGVKQNWPGLLVWAGYALANVGLWLQLR